MEHVPEWSRDLPGKLADSWPKDEKGGYVAPAKLTSCTQLDMGDAIVEGLLDSAGIPHFKRYPHYGGFGNLMLGMSAECTSTSPRRCWRTRVTYLKEMQ